ncbi:MAG: M48 family metallopeptidase [Luteolibacter sp.]|uniref:M48 family metallopeptidase n=1 Tax=Luteolibacter sp. TaxID=1962973 RepID=UPI0032648369
MKPLDSAKAKTKDKPSAAYSIGMGFVTAGMIILPLIYIAFTVLVCWSVYFFATHYFVEIWEWPIGHSKFSLLAKIVCSITPLLVGAAIAIAMVKPLFARRGTKMQPIVLLPDVEPRVHAMAQDVCRRVGAPAPKRIEINCDLNASAGFNRGWRGFFKNELILTIGMPLVAGLTERQLAGVIAHEFGHFRQGAGMRLSYLIRSVNFWFARVVYERDAWDETLAGFGQSESIWIVLMVGCARAGVALSRGILWLLMMTGHGISGFLMRQMEYDADKWEARIAGSDSLEATLLRLNSLGHVLEKIHLEMRRSWRNRFQLPDNLPLLMEYRANCLDPEKRASIENRAGLSKTGFFDTHPSVAERIRFARRLAEPGAIANDSPARDLFDNFEGVGRLVTLAHYDDDLNVPVTPDFLIPVARFIEGPTGSGGSTMPGQSRHVG